LGCKFCLRRQDGENDLTFKERQEIIDVLSSRGIIRLTITGGEPMLANKKSEVLSILEYAHSKKIHTCLSTTGHNISESDIRRLENSLDQLLLSIHSRSEHLAQELYESAKTWDYLSKNLEKVLEWTKNSRIIIEISTVVSQVNIHHVVELGKWLFEQNPNIFWRLDEYYPNGQQDAQMCNLFELSADSLAQLRIDVTNEFPKQILERRIRISPKASRQLAPDLMITPQGNLVTTSNNTYSSKGDIKDLLFLELQNRRDWKEYRDCMRIDWNW
jgi:MoaA/NifB/PqqE/SkfB family radical SAM enzyme